MDLKQHFSGKNIVVTGAAGTVGSGLIRALACYDVASLKGFDNNETALFNLDQDLKGAAEIILGDIRDLEKLRKVFRGAEFIFHCAALKHVPLCERNPLDAIKTNILGVQNVIDASITCNVHSVVHASSDKAVNPFNVMGTTKLMGEQLIKAANLEAKDQVFISTRFGNVLGSRGSVVPVFLEQIRTGGPVTLTSGSMTRFVMSIDEAISLLLESISIARGGEIFVTKMYSIMVKDLAQVMIDQLATDPDDGGNTIEVVEIGERPGEKRFEELMNSEEVRRSVELERHYVILPALTDLYSITPLKYPGLKDTKIDDPYNSSMVEHLSQEKLKSYLNRIGMWSSVT